jgi:ElaB/YqjD/DUF883 family membrane-anchored ribosome-binding protein
LNRSRLDKLETDLREFIDERNEVFHSGKPLSATPEELHWQARRLARQTLNKLRIKLQSEQWQTKDDLINWVDDQYNRFLK